MLLFDRLAGLSHSVLEDMLNLASGCCYLVSDQSVADNISTLASAGSKEYKAFSVAYSYKTNYEPLFVRQAMLQGAYSEVVSEREFDYACTLGAIPSTIIVNGPGKSPSFLRRAMGSGCTLIVDSIDELERVCQLHQQQPFSGRLGVRVSPKLPFVSTPSRFGIDLDNDGNRAGELLSLANFPQVGLHMHHSGDRSIESFVQRLDFLVQCSLKLEIQNLCFIDCGGGLPSAIPEGLAQRLPYSVSGLCDYGTVLGRRMLSHFPDEQVELIVEPGTGILADAGVFLTRVMDTKRYAGESVCIVDGTLFSIDPLRSSVPPELAVVSIDHPSDVPDGNGYRPTTARVCGNSCMEIDEIHPSISPAPRLGDIMLIAQKGAYADCMSSAFIQGAPAVVAVSFADEKPSFALHRQRNAPHLLSLT